MCTQCYFEGNDISTVGEWKQIIGEPVFCDGCQPLGDEFCLCGLNVVASAEKAGLRVKRDRFGDYEILRPSKSMQKRMAIQRGEEWEGK